MKNPGTKIFITVIALLMIFSMLVRIDPVKGEGEGFTAYLPAIFNGDAPPPPLTVGYSEFSGNFNPFFFTLGIDGDVVEMTQIKLLTTDRVAGIVENAITGETRDYNGTPYLYKGPADTSVEYDDITDTTKYTAKLRNDLTFSDGVPVTADDLIFTYYTYLDPSYEGQNTLSSYPIVGLKEYQTQTTSEVYDKYEIMFEDIYNAGHDHFWNTGDVWTQEQQEYVWTRFDAAVLLEAEKIVDYVVANHLSYSEDYIGYTEEEVLANDGLQVTTLGMVLWGFGEVENNIFTAPSDTSWDLDYTFPSCQDFKNEILFTYNYDIQSAFPYESPDGTDVYNNVKTEFILYWGQLEMGSEGVPNIAGIVKLDPYTVAITLNGFSAPAVYDILGIPITPLHYYGDASKYDYENNMFGFDFGDLSSQHSKTDSPMGAGPYQFINYENETVYFEANPYYYKGEPKTEEIQFKILSSSETPAAIQAGNIDLGEVSSNLLEEIKSYNSNGELTGDFITTSLFDNLGYGYIGINASTVNVNGDIDSDASKNLRKGIATILAVHRHAAIENYFGDMAQVIEYPISNTSWAAPQPADPGYQIAFSVDVYGDPIYTPEMNVEQMIAAAETAALSFFEAAGYTIEDGLLSTAPNGAKLTYEAYVPGGSVGDHPNYEVYTATRDSLAKIGMEFVINDPADWNVMLDAIGANEQEIWTMAWGSNIDPDMYQVYYSTNIPGGDGTGSNYYHIQDPLLDQLIMDARLSDDQEYRKAIYKICLDIIMDWSVEIPTYQRQNTVIFSTQRINMDTVTPDITTFWGWMNDIELLEMND